MSQNSTETRMRDLLDVVEEELGVDWQADRNAGNEWPVEADAYRAALLERLRPRVGADWRELAERGQRS